jgi:hypothetical protein
MTKQESYTQMEEVEKRLVELLSYQRNRLSYRKRTEMAVEMVRMLESEGQFPEANYAFDNGVLTLDLTKLIGSQGKHWVSEIECSRNVNLNRRRNVYCEQTAITSPTDNASTRLSPAARSTALAPAVRVGRLQCAARLIPLAWLDGMSPRAASVTGRHTVRPRQKEVTTRRIHLHSCFIVRLSINNPGRTQLSRVVGPQRSSNHQSPPTIASTRVIELTQPIISVTIRSTISLKYRRS